VFQQVSAVVKVVFFSHYLGHKQRHHLAQALHMIKGQQHKRFVVTDNNTATLEWWQRTPASGAALLRHENQAAIAV
jgi:hypothetical protein